jgi:hypothetical protein
MVYLGSMGCVVRLVECSEVHDHAITMPDQATPHIDVGNDEKSRVGWVAYVPTKYANGAVQ